MKLISKKKTNRLVAFGCSFTFGHGLPDCYDKENNRHPGKYPSKYSWANTYANNLGVPCLNKSRCGSSITRIAWDVYNFKFNTNDIAVIMWTLPNRTGYITDDKVVNEFEWFNIEDKKNNFYFKNIDSEIFNLFNYVNAINGIEKHLNRKKIRYLNLEFENSLNLFKKNNMLELHRNLNFDNHDVFLADVPPEHFDLAIDGRHPGHKSHNWYAKMLTENKSLKTKLSF
jgi:hypothetical protein